MINILTSFGHKYYIKEIHLPDVNLYHNYIRYHDKILPDKYLKY